jgi:hypothetical protein
MFWELKTKRRNFKAGLHIPGSISLEKIHQENEGNPMYLLCDY